MSDSPQDGAQRPVTPAAAEPAGAPGAVAPRPLAGTPIFADAPTTTAGHGGRRTAIAAILALLVVAAGVVASLLGAQTVAHNDAAKTRSSFGVTAAGIASTVNLSIQREEDLLNSTSAFFAEHSNASPAQFTAWARRNHLLRRYPELEKLGLVAVVRATQLAAFEEQITGHAATAPTRLTTTSPAAKTAVAATPGKAIRIIPPGDRGFYCLTSAGLARSSVHTPPAGLDYCARSATLLAARDSGLSSYAAASVGGAKALTIQTPVYKGEAPPTTVTDRMGAFVGWLTEVLSPRVILAQALSDHSGDAIRLRYHAGASNVAFVGGTPQAGGQSQTIGLGDGWTARSSLRR